MTRFSRTLHLQHEALCLAVRGDEAHPLRIASRGERSARCTPSTSTVPPLAARRPKSVSSSSLRPAPTSPASPTISPAPTSRSTSAKRPERRESARGNAQDGHRSIVDALPSSARVSSSSFAADHHVDQRSPGQLRRRGLADAPAVPQHGDAIGELEDLVEPVRDEDRRRRRRPEACGPPRRATRPRRR